MLARQQYGLLWLFTKMYPTDAAQLTAESSGKLCRRQEESSKYVFFFVVKISMTVGGCVFNLFFSLKADSVHLALEMWTCSPNNQQQSAEITRMPGL